MISNLVKFPLSQKKRRTAVLEAIIQTTNSQKKCSFAFVKIDVIT